MDKDRNKQLLRLEKDKIRAKEKNNYKEIAEICNYKGELYSKISYFSEALQEHNEELKYCRKNGDVLGEAIAYRKIGECHAMMEQFEDALVNALRYRKLVEENENNLEIQRAWTTIGRIYFLQYSSEKNATALKCAKAATKQSLLAAEKYFDLLFRFCDSGKFCRLRSELKERELNEMFCRSYMNLGLIYEAIGTEECVKCFEQALTIGRKYGFKDEMFQCQLNLGNHYLKAKNFTAALKIFDDSIKTAKELINKAELPEAYVCKGQTLLCTTDFTGASYYFKKAYFSRFAEQDLRQKAHHLSKHTSKVLKGLKQFNESRSGDEKMEICEKLGDCFAELKCYRSALKYYELQLQFAVSLKKSKDTIATIHVSLGQTFLDNKQYSEALQHFKNERELRKGNSTEEVHSSLKIIEAMIGTSTAKEVIKKEYKRALSECGNDIKLKRTVLEDYLAYLNSDKGNLMAKEISAVESTLQEINPTDEEEIDIRSDTCDNLSEPSDFTDSDSDNEESTSINRRTRRKRVGRNEKGETPLHRSCIDGNLRQVRQLVEKGHSVNERDNCGWLPIHEAANYGYSEIVEFLIDNGADINDRGGKFCEGITPLHDACINGHLDVIKILIRKGANVTAQDNSGKTPFHCLEDYCQKSKDLSTSEKEELDSVMKELKLSMERLNYDFTERKRLSNKRSLSPLVGNSVTSKSSYYKDIELDNPFVDDYEQTISNLRNPVDTYHSDKRRRLSPKRVKESLLDENAVCDDWLVNDMGEPRKRTQARQPRRPRREFFKEQDYVSCPSNREYRDISIEGVNESHDDDKEEGDCEVNIIDTEFEHNNDNNNIYSSKVTTLASRSKDSYSSHIDKQMDTNIYIRVFVNNLPFFVEVNSDSTVKILAEETAKRYYEQKHVLPTLTLKTKDGALLSNNDLVAKVASIEDYKLYADIESCESQPLDERYVNECKQLCVERCIQLEKQLRTAFETGRLSLRNFYLKENQLKPLSNAIKCQETVECLDISYSNILIVDLKNEFLGVVMKLPNLKRLNLECTGLTNLKLKLIANSSCPIFELNLSYNPIRSSDSFLISQILNNFVSLKTINLQYCELDDEFVVESVICEALSKTSVSEVVFQNCSGTQLNPNKPEKWKFKCSTSSALKCIR